MKKLLASLLCVAMLCTLTVGCGGTTKKTEPPKTGGSTGADTGTKTEGDTGKKT